MLNLSTRIKYLVVATLVVASIGAQNVSAATPLLVSDFLKSNHIGDDSSFNFSKHASESNGNGIYLNSESGVYYYRGQVDNNIIYANRCWQIMGTTVDGAVKFIYNGLPSESETCENVGNDSAALLNVSYGAANNGSYEASNSKVQLDAWFVDNLMDYANDFADVIYCNDTDYVNAHKRIAEDGKPTFVCAKEHQLTVANGKLAYPISMMSADELLFSGAGYGVAPAEGEGYYADTGKFQTITQQSANKMFYNNSLHFLNRSSGTNYSANIRPVVAIASDSAYILGGSGTKLDPYRLKVVPPVPYQVDSLDDSLLVDNDVNSASYGERISFTVDKNRKVKKITFTDESGEPVDIDLIVVDEANGKYAFDMPDFSVYLNVEYEEDMPSNPSENVEHEEDVPPNPSVNVEHEEDMLSNPDTLDAGKISVLLFVSCVAIFNLIIRANSKRHF